MVYARSHQFSNCIGRKVPCWVHSEEMKILRFVLLIFAACLLSSTAQPVRHPVFLHWSREEIVKSPDERLQVEVHPILTDDENHSPVVIRRLVDQRTWNLFTLTRAAEVQWSPDSQKILVIDQPTVDHYEVRLFSSEGKMPGIDTDKMIRSAVSDIIGPGRKMGFYLPTFVSWESNELIVAVGGTSWTGINRPVDTYCFAAKIDSNSGKVLTTLSEDMLRNQFHSECRLNP